MNDIVLSSLINLFALFGAENGVSREDAELHLEHFLKSYSGIRDIHSYMTLHSDLRDFYVDYPDMAKDSIVEGVATKLLGHIQQNERGAILLRLMEFCSTNKDKYDPQNPLFKQVAENFMIGEKDFAHFVNFIDEVEDEAVKTIPMEAGEAMLKTLLLKDINCLYFTYDGPSEMLMNDIPVVNGIFQVWQQSGVLKARGGRSIYYSTIMQFYGEEESSEAFELCGRDLDFRFDNSPDNGLHDFSFTLHNGQLVAIMGGSGVGKSTLLSILNGSIRPQKGSITINGHDISEPQAKAHIGFVPQDDLLIEELTVYQNLWYTAKLCFDKMPDEELDKKVMSVLTQLGLEAARDLQVGSPINKYISGGQRKRLNIALELIREPAILFLDEPTSGLSSSDTEKVVNLLKEQTCKGKLIVVNIHQPSSDVYKLFDRLWLLDKGGRPVFDGNPIEAVSYFKTAANYADPDSTACPTCGNVNPEIVLNIIDEKSLDPAGQLTEKRKVSPQAWHELYLDRRPAMSAPEISAVPETDQKRPNVFKQFLIFLRRNISTKITNLQYVLVTLLEAPLLAAICAVLTRFTPESGVYSIMENKNLVSYFFMAIIVAIFLGMSGSAEEIIKDRALLKREKFLHLSYGSYISSKIIYMAAVCLVQTFLFIVVGNLIMGIHGLFWIWWMILFVSAFLSALIGLLLSQCLNSVVAIYISIPILLIPQILLCGLVVKFDDLNSKSETGNVPVIGDIIPSRWAYEAMAVSSFSMNEYEKQFFEQDRDKYTCMFYREAFLYELQSQLEQRQDEIDRPDKEEKPEHLEILRSELPYLAEICGMDDYAGDWSYGSVKGYLDEAYSILSDRGNETTLRMDRQVSNFIRENGKEELVNLKRDHYNLQLENLVLNRDTKHLAVVRGSHVVPRSGYVFLNPRTHNGRASFYSGVKLIGNSEIPTLWYNMAVLLLMCLLVGACLYSDFPGRFVRKERN